MGQHRITPVLQYEFTAADVGRAIDDYLESQANLFDKLFDKPEGDALRHPDFKRQISQASEGAFGYVTRLMDELLKLGAKERFEQIERWRKEPGSLPFGVYQQRAREMFAAGEVLKSLSPDELLTERLHRLFVQALAALALLPEPLLTAAGLADLIAENDSDKGPLTNRLQTLARQFLVSLQSKSPALSETPTAVLPYLVFDHLLTYELALAYWELLDTPHALEGDGSEPPWRRIARHAQTLRLHRSEQSPFTSAEPVATPSATEEKPVLTPRQRQSADARLHRRLGEGSARYWPRPTTRRPATQEMIKEWSDSQRYVLLWGPWHAFMSGESRSEYEFSDPSPAVPRALALLLDAGYLQTVVRIGGAASQDVLRRSYIAADQASGAQATQSLRHRVESAVSQWYPHLVDGSLQVGALLWNLLGGWDPAKDRAAHWKASLDQAALVTALPGVPMGLVRQLHGYDQQAFSPCGQWLVTTGRAGAAVWEMRQGAHRMHPVARLLHWNTEKVCCATVDNVLYLLGFRDALLWVGLVDLHSGTAVIARYAGHKRSVTSVALHVEKEGLIGLSGGGDDSLGVLQLTRAEVAAHAAQQAHTAEPQPGRLARYAGHKRPVTSVALHVEKDGLIGLSGGWDNSLGVLDVRRADVAAHAQEQAQSKQPKDHWLQRFSSVIRYQWRSADKVAPRDGSSSVFWGFSDHAIIQASVKAVAENLPQFFIGVFPFHEPDFTPHDITQLDEQTVVVGGASGNNIALLLLK